MDVPSPLQMARLLQRDAVDDGLAVRMIAAQAERRERLAIADDVLVNDGELGALARWMCSTGHWRRWQAHNKAP